METKIKLDLPPALNSVYRSRIVNGKPITYKSKESKTYTEYVRWQLNRLRPTDQDVHLHLEFYFRRDRDIDSGLKVLLDALASVLYHDDRQVTRLDVWKYKLPLTSNIKPGVVLSYKYIDSLCKDEPF
jgi:Holliday junction resolvase RusA-like endonuclease